MVVADRAVAVLSIIRPAMASWSLLWINVFPSKLPRKYCSPDPPCSERGLSPTLRAQRSFVPFTPGTRKRSGHSHCSPVAPSGPQVHLFRSFRNGERLLISFFVDYLFTSGFSLWTKYRYAPTFKKLTNTETTFHTITGREAINKP